MIHLYIATCLRPIYCKWQKTEKHFYQSMQCTVHIIPQLDMEMLKVVPLPKTLGMLENGLLMTNYIQ